jgi:DnaJ-class molecular chaperone
MQRAQTMSSKTVKVPCIECQGRGGFPNKESCISCTKMILINEAQCNQCQGQGSIVFNPTSVFDKLNIKVLFSTGWRCKGQPLAFGTYPCSTCSATGTIPRYIREIEYCDKCNNSRVRSFTSECSKCKGIRFEEKIIWFPDNIQDSIDIMRDNNRTLLESLYSAYGHSDAVERASLFPQEIQQRYDNYMKEALRKCSSCNGSGQDMATLSVCAYCTGSGNAIL